MVGLVLAGDVVLYRDSLARVLDRESNLKVVGVASTVTDLMVQIQDLDPDVVLLDVGLADGLGAVRSIRARKPAIMVLAFAVSEAVTDLVTWAQAGIRGFVSRDASMDELIATINGATNGESICTPRLTARLLEGLAATSNQILEARPSDMALTGREREIVRLLDLGKSNKEIAQLLCIAVPTVKNHVHSILVKLQIDRRSQAAPALDDVMRLARS